MSMQEWTIKFSISGEMHYMTIPAESATDAKAIFREWMWGVSGQHQDDPTPNSVWRVLEGRKPGDELVFRNDWVAAWEVIGKRFIITD